MYLGLDSNKEHEYVLLEEVVSNNTNNGLNSNLPTHPNQRMVGMHEMPLQVRNKWRNETKFVLKRVGQDPSWRARLGNLMSFAEEQETVRVAICVLNILNVYLFDIRKVLPMIEKNIFQKCSFLCI